MVYKLVLNTQSIRVIFQSHSRNFILISEQSISIAGNDIKKASSPHNLYGRK